jgi:hypothetical protein
MYYEPELCIVVRDLDCYQQLGVQLPEQPDFSSEELVFICDPFYGCEWDIHVTSVLECEEYIALEYEVVFPCMTCTGILPVCIFSLIPNSPKPVHAHAELVEEQYCD